MIYQWISAGDEAERDAMNFVTAEFCTLAFPTSTQRLPIVTDKFQNAMIAPFIDSGAWL